MPNLGVSGLSNLPFKADDSHPTPCHSVLVRLQTSRALTGPAGINANYNRFCLTDRKVIQTWPCWKVCARNNVEMCPWAGTT